MYLIHHTFLPPELPQQDDFDPRRELILLDTVSDALQRFRFAAEHDQRDIVESVSAMLGNLTVVRDDSGAINERNLQSALQMLPDRGMFPPSDLRCIPLTNQRPCYTVTHQSPKCRCHYQKDRR